MQVQCLLRSLQQHNIILFIVDKKSERQRQPILPAIIYSVEMLQSLQEPAVRANIVLVIYGEVRFTIRQGLARAPPVDWLTTPQLHLFKFTLVV